MSEQFNPSLDGSQPMLSSTRKWAAILLAICLVVFALYALAAAISMVLLNYIAPVTLNELKLASWRVNAPCMTPLALYLGLISALVSMIWLLQGRGIGILLLALSFLFIGIGLPATAFRAAVLEGDAKIGCYDYSSRACLSMLGLPSNDVGTIRSIEVSPGPQLPIEVIAVLRAPLDLFQVDRLNLALDAQRHELNGFMTTHRE